jgi:tRNA (uracil-5-)-methyltransferase TRM9
MPAFYDIHAADFSRSRFRLWPHVKQFLDGIQPNSRVLDIGCGNGKNMLYRTDLQMIGLEYSEELCKICVDRKLSVVQGDARCLPFPDNSFDAIIMIAVIHHINPEEHIATLNEIKRVLKTGGTCLITNWAVEQPADSRRSFTPGLNMVIWKYKEDIPLPYWVMDKHLADEFAKTIPSGLTVTDLTWDAGNWEFWIMKTTS